MHTHHDSATTDDSATTGALLLSWRQLCRACGGPVGAVFGGWGLVACVGALWTWRTPVALLPVASLALLVLLHIGPALPAVLHHIVAQPATTSRMQAAQQGARLLTQPALLALYAHSLLLLTLLVTLLCLLALVQAHPLLLIFAPVPLVWRRRLQGIVS